MKPIKIYLSLFLLTFVLSCSDKNEKQDEDTYDVADASPEEAADMALDVELEDEEEKALYEQIKDVELSKLPPLESASTESILREQSTPQSAATDINNQKLQQAFEQHLKPLLTSPTMCGGCHGDYSSFDDAPLFASNDTQKALGVLFDSSQGNTPLIDLTQAGGSALVIYSSIDHHCTSDTVCTERATKLEEAISAIANSINQ